MGRKRIGGLLAILSIALVTLGLVFGASTTAYASSVEKWNEDKTFDSDAEIKVPVIVENDVTVTIAEGKTVTVSVGINAYEHTLTVTGKGTLAVKGEDGPDQRDDEHVGADGGEGLSAITGDVIVDGGATLLCTGGSGGKGGSAPTPGIGGNGGAGLDGNLTVKGGTTKLAGGMGGEVGLQDSDDTSGSAAGKQGVAVTNEITANVIQISDDGENYEALEGTKTDAPYVIATSDVEPDPDPKPATNHEMFRLYNPNSGEHFYTASPAERDNVIAAGWSDEGVGWIAPSDGAPVYRLYNANAGEHHYTTSPAERDALVAAGWNDEGIGWKSAGTDGVPLYRQYNPFQFACNHNYTANAAERDMLVGLGWNDEGIAWYGVRLSE